MDTSELEWLAGDLEEWVGACLVEGHSRETLSTVLSIFEGLVSGEDAQSADFLANYKPRRRNERPYRVIARRSGARRFDS